jgi:hypothetical protein
MHSAAMLYGNAPDQIRTLMVRIVCYCGSTMHISVLHKVAECPQVGDILAVGQGCRQDQDE